LGFVGNPIKYTGYGCSGSHEELWLAVDCFEICVLLYGIIKLYHVRGEYGIAWELSLVSVVWVVTAFGGTIALLLNHQILPDTKVSMTERQYEDVHAALILARNIPAALISLAYPIWQSFGNTEAFTPLWSSPNSFGSLDSLLTDLVCVRYFRAHLDKKGRGSLLSCLLRIDLFRDMDPSDVDRVQSEASRIFALFIDPGGEQAIPLQDSTRMNVSGDILAKKATVNVFDGVTNEILQILQVEYGRFVGSDLGNACLAQLEKEEQLKEILENSGMIEREATGNVQFQ